MSELLKYETTKDGKKIAALLAFDGWYQDCGVRYAQWNAASVSVNGKPLTAEDRAKATVWLREERWSEISRDFFGAGNL